MIYFSDKSTDRYSKYGFFDFKRFLHFVNFRSVTPSTVEVVDLSAKCLFIVSIIDLNQYTTHPQQHTALILLCVQIITKLLELYVERNRRDLLLGNSDLLLSFLLALLLRLVNVALSGLGLGQDSDESFV